MDEKLKKARIRVFIPEKKDDPGFDVLFNPNEYRLSKANQPLFSQRHPDEQAE